MKNMYYIYTQMWTVGHVTTVAFPFQVIYDRDFLPVVVCHRIAEEKRGTIMI